MIYIVVLLAILTIPCPNRVIHAVVNSPSRKATTPRHKAVGYEPRSQHKKPICTYRDMKHLSSKHSSCTTGQMKSCVEHAYKDLPLHFARSPASHHRLVQSGLGHALVVICCVVYIDYISNLLKQL